MKRYRDHVEGGGYHSSESSLWPLQPLSSQGVVQTASTHDAAPITVPLSSLSALQHKMNDWREKYMREEHQDTSRDLFFVLKLQAQLSSCLLFTGAAALFFVAGGLLSVATLRPQQCDQGSINNYAAGAAMVYLSAFTCCQRRMNDASWQRGYPSWLLLPTAAPSTEHPPKKMTGVQSLDLR